MTAAQTCAALTAYRVDLVNKDDRRSLLFRLLKQVADTAGADAHIQLHKIGTGDGEKLYPGLTGNGLGNQGFTGSGRAHQQDALGNARAQSGVFLGIPQKIHNLLELGLFLIGTGHIIKGHAGIGGSNGPGLCKAHHALFTAAAALGSTAHHKHPDSQKQQGNQQIGHEHQPPGRFRRSGVVIALDDAPVVLIDNEVVEILIEYGKAGHLIDDGGIAVFIRIL